MFLVILHENTPFFAKRMCLKSQGTYFLAWQSEMPVVKFHYFELAMANLGNTSRDRISLLEKFV